MVTIQLIALEMVDEPPMDKANIDKDATLTIDGHDYAGKIKIQQYHPACMESMPKTITGDATITNIVSPTE